MMSQIIDWNLKININDAKDGSESQSVSNKKGNWTSRERFLKSDGLAVVDIVGNMTKEQAEENLSNILKAGIQIYGKGFLTNEKKLAERIKFINKYFPQGRVVSMSTCRTVEYVYDTYIKNDDFSSEKIERVLVEKRVVVDNSKDANKGQNSKDRKKD